MPANATYITGTSVAVSVSASKTGFTRRDPHPDLAAPSSRGRHRLVQRHCHPRQSAAPRTRPPRPRPPFTGDRHRVTFPTVDKGDQTLTGFAYSTDTVTFGDTAPSLIAPSGAHTTLAYSATPSTVCTVDAGSVR